jgi:hypothetical protein
MDVRSVTFDDMMGSFILLPKNPPQAEENSHELTQVGPVSTIIITNYQNEPNTKSPETNSIINIHNENVKEKKNVQEEEETSQNCKNVNQRDEIEGKSPPAKMEGQEGDINKEQGKSQGKEEINKEPLEVKYAGKEDIVSPIPQGVPKYYVDIIKEAYLDQDITEQTSLYVLTGIDDPMVELLEKEANITTLGQLAWLPVDFSDTHNSIVESKLIPNIDQYITNAFLVLQNLKEFEELEGNFENISVNKLKGINDNDLRLYLEKHALVYTLRDLIELPQKYPGIYYMLNETGAVSEMDKYISKAKYYLGALKTTHRRLTQ